MNACSEKINDLSILTICDSLILKYDIDVAKFLVENQILLEDLLYPVTLPSTIHAYMNMDSANAIGSTDPAIVLEHNSISGDYGDILLEFSKECTSRAELNDLDGIKSCMSLVESENSHMKIFNQNAKSEFQKILGD